jgi:HTH-like domain
VWKKVLEKWHRPVGHWDFEVELLSKRPSSLESRRIRKEVLELSAKHPRYGYRRVTALMRREGFEVNVKRVARIRREEGIKVSKKQRRMKRLGISTAGLRSLARFGAGTSWLIRPKMEAVFAFLLCWTNTTGHAWLFILRGRSEPSMS